MYDARYLHIRKKQIGAERWKVAGSQLAHALSGLKFGFHHKGDSGKFFFMSEEVFPLIEILQSIDNGKTGSFSTTTLGFPSELFVHRGQITHAACGNLVGEKALYIMLQFTRDSVAWNDQKWPPHQVLGDEIQNYLINLAYQQIPGEEELKTLIELGEGDPCPESLPDSQVFGFIVEGGGFEPFRFDLEKNEMLIGRDPDESHVCIPDDSVSGRHALLKNRGDRVFFQDLGSTNGSRLDGELVEECELREGCMILVGKVMLTLKVFERESPQRRGTEEEAPREDSEDMLFEDDQSFYKLPPR